MEISIKMMVAIVLAVIFFLILVMLISGMAGDAGTSIGGFFDFFKNLIGIGPNK